VKKIQISLGLSQMEKIKEDVENERDERDKNVKNKNKKNNDDSDSKSNDRDEYWAKSNKADSIQRKDIIEILRDEEDIGFKNVAGNSEEFD
jgi:hypothetical protein